MADKYEVDVRLELENMPVRGAGVVVPCILEEGNITVYSGKTLSDGAVRRAESHYAFASEIEKNDIVYVASDAAYTYDACQGMPVVAKPVTTEGVRGIVLDDPRKLVARPSSSTAANSVAKRIAGKFYRVALVWFPAFAYTSQLANAASPNISVGGALIYDVSSEVMIGGGTTSGITAAHVATADAVYVGCFWGLMAAGESQE
ncbi:MAG: hypothetical protein WC455_31030 [Dehalococcoidia bacterium]|jgi:hypothetical protein